MVDAHEKKLINTAAEVEVELRENYQAKLLHRDYFVPDTFQLYDGWLSAVDGILALKLYIIIVWSILNLSPYRRYSFSNVKQLFI